MSIFMSAVSKVELKGALCVTCYKGQSEFPLPTSYTSQCVTKE
jgi:hypothetical protein